MCVGRIEDELCGGGNHDAHPLGLACVCAHDAHFLGADMLVCVSIGVDFMSNSEKHEVRNRNNYDEVTHHKDFEIQEGWQHFVLAFRPVLVSASLLIVVILLMLYFVVGKI